MGVWNLDDYQFVSFIWGAAQLSPEKQRVKPKSISDPDMAELLRKENHFFACLSYIHQVKSGPFHEHSNQLWNISAVPLWSKVLTCVLDNSVKLISKSIHQSSVKIITIPFVARSILD